MSRSAYPDPYPQYASTGDLSDAVAAIEDTIAALEPGGEPGTPVVTGFHAPFLTPQAGTLHTVAMFANNLTTTAEIANRLDAVPYIPARTFTIDQASVEVTTAVAGALAKIGFYSHGTNGYPNALIDGSGDLDCSTTGEKTWVTSRTFTAGEPVWLVMHYSSTATFRAVGLSQLMPLSATSTQAVNCVVNGSATYASGLPAAFPSPGLTSRNVPAVKLRAA